MKASIFLIHSFSLLLITIANTLILLGRILRLTMKNSPYSINLEPEKSNFPLFESFVHVLTKLDTRPPI